MLSKPPNPYGICAPSPEGVGNLKMSFRPEIKMALKDFV